MQDGISELGFSIRIDSQSELGLLMNQRDVSESRMYITIYLKSESSDFMNTLSESELRFVINAEK